MPHAVEDFPVQMAKLVASPDFRVGKPPRPTVEESLELMSDSTVLLSSMRESAEKALRGERLDMSDDVDVISALARRGVVYAQALHLAQRLVQIAGAIPTSGSDEQRGVPEDAIKQVEKMWTVFYPATQKSIDRLDRHKAMSFIEDIANHPLAVKIIQANGSPTLRALVERWPIKRQGNTGDSKYDLMREWYVSIGGTDWPKQRWEDDWNEPPNLEQSSLSGLGYGLTSTFAALEQIAESSEVKK